MPCQEWQNDWGDPSDTPYTPPDRSSEEEED